MPESEGAKMSIRKRPHVGIWIIALFIGILGLYRVTLSPHYGSFRTLDVIQLLVSGAGFGVALTVLIFGIVKSRT